MKKKNFRLQKQQINLCQKREKERMIQKEKGIEKGILSKNSESTYDICRNRKKSKFRVNKDVLESSQSKLGTDRKQQSQTVIDRIQSTIFSTLSDCYYFPRLSTKKVSIAFLMRLLFLRNPSRKNHHHRVCFNTFTTFKLCPFARICCKNPI